MNVGLLLIATQKGKQSTYKKKNLYIYIYRQKEKRVKTATKGHKKRGYKIAPKITRQMVHLFGGCFACFACTLLGFIGRDLLL